MNPGPVKVHVRDEGSGKQTITESDDCASAGIAAITTIANNKYAVAAGTTGGKCPASFTSPTSFRVRNRTRSC